MWGHRRPGGVSSLLLPQYTYPACIESKHPSQRRPFIAKSRALIWLHFLVCFKNYCTYWFEVFKLCKAYASFELLKLCWHFLFVTLFATLAVIQSIFPLESWSELHGVICHCCLVCWAQQFHPRHYHHKSVRSEGLYLCCLTLICLSLFVIIWCKWMFIADWNLQPGHPLDVKEDYFLVHHDFNTVCLWTSCSLCLMSNLPQQRG